jgi:hypothetical protein
MKRNRNRFHRWFPLLWSRCHDCDKEFRFEIMYWQGREKHGFFTLWLCKKCKKEREVNKNANE